MWPFRPLAVAGNDSSNMPTFTRIAAIFSVLGFCYSYELGVRYHYAYNTNVISEEDCSIKNEDGKFTNLGYQIRSSAHVTSIWESELEGGEKVIMVELIKPELHVPQEALLKKHKSELERFPQSVLLIEWINGEVKNVFTDSSDDLVLKNLKKGVASLLQNQRYPTKFSQMDVSGECVMQLKVDGRIIKKKKENCTHSLIRNNNNEIRSANVISSSEVTTELVSESEGLISSIEARDFIKMQSNMWKGASVCISSRTYMKLENKKSGASTVTAENSLSAVKAYSTKLKVNFIKDSLLADLPLNMHRDNCKDIMKAIKGYKETLKPENLAKLKSASPYLKLIDCLHLATKEEIISVLKSKKLQSILPQLLDVIAAVQTDASIMAVFETLDFLGNDIDIPERYLLAVSTVPDPNIVLLKAIMNLLLKNIKGKVHESLVLTLGALAKSYNRNGEKANTQVLQEIKDFLMRELKTCDSVKCTMIYLRGFHNAAIPDTIPILLNYISHGGKPAHEALTALKTIGVQHYNTEVLKALEKVFYEVDTKQDRSLRALAAELLLTSINNNEVLKGILSALSREENEEFSTYVVSKFLKQMAKNATLRYDIQRKFADTDVNYFNILSQRGLSTSFSNPLISTDEMNTTYNLEMEMISGGLLKRSSFDIELHTTDNNLHILSVGMFADGLSNLVGGSFDVESEENEETVAGLQLSVLGVVLRPYIFFESASELMSHVWTGTGSEPTPVLQGNFHIIDDARSVSLQNGLIVDLKLTGCLSADLSAFIEISVWHRNSHSVVKNAVALLVKGSLHIGTPFINLVEEFSFKGESAVDFTTEFKFSEYPYQMCLKMDQPDLLFRSDLQGVENIPGSKYLVKRKKKKNIFVPSKSYSFHKKNNEQCNSMFH